MIYAPLLFFLALIAPLFIRSWRAAAVGLFLQGLAMAAMVWSEGPLDTASAVLALVDMALLRSVVAPLALGQMAEFSQIDADFDVIPANLLVWTFAVILMLTGFAFALRATDGTAQAVLHVGTAVCTVLVAMLILATQRAPFGQAVAILTLENAIALFEMRSQHPTAWPLRLGLMVLFLLTLATMLVHLKRLGRTAQTPPPSTDLAIL
jgi:hydrogenase-4 membrane subunit HyfE